MLCPLFPLLFFLSFFLYGANTVPLTSTPSRGEKRKKTSDDGPSSSSPLPDGDVDLMEDMDARGPEDDDGPVGGQGEKRKNGNQSQGQGQGQGQDSQQGEIF